MISSLTLILSIISGFSLGVAFFMALKVSSILYLSGTSIWGGLLLYIMRFVITIWVFWLMAGFGAVPLLSGFGCFLLGRFFVLRFLARETDWKIP